MEDKTKLIEDKFMTTARFSTEVEGLVKEDSMSYIDAIIHYCGENDIELETVPKLISKPLKEKLKYEAQQLNYMKKTSKAKLVLV
jgi:hypothetical protein